MALLPTSITSDMLTALDAAGASEVRVRLVIAADGDLASDWEVV